MTDAKTMWSLLGEYGIRSAAELEDAIRRMEKIDIGVFAAPVENERTDRHEKNSSCAGRGSYVQLHSNSY